MATFSALCPILANITDHIPSTVLTETFREGDLASLIRLGVTPTIFNQGAPEESDPEVHAKSVGTAYGEQDVNIWSEPSTIATSSAMQQALYLRGEGISTVGGKNLILEKASKIDSDDESSGATHIVKSATFNQLVLWLLSAESDSHFRNVFFVTLYSFASPQQFIAKVEQRYTTPPGVPKLDQGMSVAIFHLKPVSPIERPHFPI